MKVMLNKAKVEITLLHITLYACPIVLVVAARWYGDAPAYASISMCLFNHLSIHPSLYSSINLPIYLFIKHLFIKQIIHSSIHLSPSIHPSINPYIHPSKYQSINLSIYPSIRLSFLSSHQQFLHIAYLGIYLSIHPSIYPSIHSYRWSSNLDLLYYPMSGTAISSGSFIKDSIRALLNITGKSYFLRPKPPFPSSGILSVIKVLKLRSPVIKILKLRSPVLKKS